MGLDAVELILEIEEEFHISIEERAIVPFRTLGNLHDYLLDRCAGHKRTDCPTRLAFYRLRQSIGQVLGVPARSLRPKTPLLPLLGNWGRRQTWRRLQQRLALDLPPLVDRKGVGTAWGAFVIPLLAFIAATVFAGDIALAFGVAVFGLIPGVVLGYAVGILLEPTIEGSCQTLGGLSRVVAAMNDRTLRVGDGPSTEDDPIWDRLCKVIVAQLGVRRETLSRDTRFVEDLGV